MIESRVRLESKSCRSRYIGSNGRFLEISRDLLPLSTSQPCFLACAKPYSRMASARSPSQRPHREVRNYLPERDRSKWWFFAFLHPDSPSNDANTWFPCCVFLLASPLLVNDKRRPILHRIFSQTHFQISDNTLIKIAIFPLKAAKNALFWKSIRPGGCPAFPPDGQIASYIPFCAK